MPFVLPPPVLEALARLNERGYAAYAVGGCVRDLARGVLPHDYDLCTDALPKQMRACFPERRVLDAGEKHGTLTVLMDGMPLEITTFRVDGSYLDGRHPQSVGFTGSLLDDLARRDFTINAMAYHPAEGLIDPFGGKQDCARRRIRCVGEPSRRFAEDALRILRAVRFSATLGFAVEPQTAAAMRAHRERLALVSRERVAAELLRALEAKHAPQALAQFSEIVFAAVPALRPAGWQAGIEALSRLPTGDLPLRLAALLHGEGIDAARAALASLRLSRSLTQETLWLLSADAPLRLPETALLLSRCGQARLLRLIALRQASGRLPPSEADALRAEISRVLTLSPPLTLRELAVHGEDLRRLGLRGAQIGRALNDLHARVLLGQSPNDREALLALAAREYL